MAICWAWMRLRGVLNLSGMCSMEDRISGDIPYVRAMAELCVELGFAEISLRRDFGDGQGRIDVRLSRSPTLAQAVAGARPEAVESVEVAVSKPEAAPGEASGRLVESPMVGTVYLGPEPGSDPFVGPGSEVREGDTLLIVEAMKTMNFIPAPESGTVREILVGDGEPVEYGSPLVRLG